MQTNFSATLAAEERLALKMSEIGRDRDLLTKQRMRLARLLSRLRNAGNFAGRQRPNFVCEFMRQRVLVRDE